MPSKHRYKSKSGKIVMDMSDYDGLIHRLQTARDEVVHKLAQWSNDWGKMYKTEYSQKISYATGFKRSHKYGSSTPFYEVEFSTDAKGLVSIHVGHMSFIAKFLEVGTQAHMIAPKIRGKQQVRMVSGIKGSKALSNAYKENKRRMADELERNLNDLLKGVK